MDVVAHARLDRDAEIALVLKAQAGDRKAGERLIREHQRAITHEARSWGRDTEDLEQEVALGLWQAIQVFDPSHGARLLTFAMQRMRASARDYSFGAGRTVALASKSARKAYRAHRTTPDASDADIAAQTGVKAATVASARAAMCGTVDVDDMFAPPSSHVTPEDVVLEREHSATLLAAAREAIATLDERERVLLERSYAEDAASLAQIARDDLGVSRERARQLHNRAIADVREKVEAKLDVMRSARAAAVAAPVAPVRRVRKPASVVACAAKALVAVVAPVVRAAIFTVRRSVLRLVDRLRGVDAQSTTTVPCASAACQRAQVAPTAGALASVRSTAMPMPSATTVQLAPTSALTCTPSLDVDAASVSVPSGSGFSARSFAGMPSPDVSATSPPVATPSERSPASPAQDTASSSASWSARSSPWVVDTGPPTAMHGAWPPNSSVFSLSFGRASPRSSSIRSVS